MIESNTKLKGIDNCNLYIRNLWNKCSQKDLDDLFRHYGHIVQSRVYSNGVGFVKYASPQEAEKAISFLDGKCPNSYCIQPLKIRYAHKKDNQMSANSFKKINNFNQNNIYLRYLPNDFTESNLYDLCVKYGKIDSCKLFVDQHHSNEKYQVGFTRYCNPIDALNAVKNLNGIYLYQRLDINSLQCTTPPIIVKLANSDVGKQKGHLFNPNNNLIPSESSHSNNLSNGYRKETSSTNSNKKLSDNFNFLAVNNLNNKNITNTNTNINTNINSNTSTTNTISNSTTPTTTTAINSNDITTTTSNHKNTPDINPITTSMNTTTNTNTNNPDNYLPNQSSLNYNNGIVLSNMLNISNFSNLQHLPPINFQTNYFTVFPYNTDFTANVINNMNTF